MSPGPKRHKPTQTYLNIDIEENLSLAVFGYGSTLV